MHDIDRTQFGFGSGPNPFQYGGRGPGGHILSEEQEADLAMELLSASNEQELENFLGDLIKKAGSAVGSFIKSPTGQALTGTLKDLAKQYLPVAGKALGSMIGGQTGANIGGQLGSAVSGAFEMEAGEQEMEDAKTFVRLAVDAAKNAAAAPPNANPRRRAAGRRASRPNARSGSAAECWRRHGRCGRQRGRFGPPLGPLDAPRHNAAKRE
jgi:uncharacterized protein (DUF697 family)